MYGALDGFFIVSAHGVCDNDICAERDSDKKIHYESYNRTVCADRSDGRGALVARKVADDGEIGRIK